MTIYVCTNAHSGDITRWKSAEKKVWKTHEGTMNGAYDFSSGEIETMRVYPPINLAVKVKGQELPK